MRDPLGFTLIELLVAMVAGSLLLVALGQALYPLSRALKARPQQETRMQITTATPAVAGLIENMTAPDPAQSLPTASGTALHFLSARPEALGEGGPVSVELATRAQGGAVALFAQITDPVAPSGPKHEAELIAGLRSIHFSVTPAASGEPLQPWALVTIDMVDTHGQLGRIVARPRLNSAGACHFDPISMTCRQ